MDICGIWWNIMELLMILHPEKSVIVWNIISTGHTAVFWHSPQHSLDSVPRIIYFITSWHFLEYGGISWNFLRILRPGNETCTYFLPVWHTAIFLHIPQHSMGFEPKIPYLQRIWDTYRTKVPIDNYWFFMYDE